jgi:hypothetical protein
VTDVIAEKYRQGKFVLVTSNGTVTEYSEKGTMKFILTLHNITQATDIVRVEVKIYLSFVHALQNYRLALNFRDI